MIGALTGTIFTSHKNPIIVFVSGVGYAVYVGEHLMAELKKDDKKTFFIHTHVREDTLDLFGFVSEEEHALFMLLLSVSGIGPKTALTIVDRGVAAVRHAVVASDVDFFTTIPRLGKKNAQKIIIELKSKLGSTKELDLASQSSGDTKEIIDALLSMGFVRNEIIEVLKKLSPKAESIEDKIREALRYLGKSK